VSSSTAIVPGALERWLTFLRNHRVAIAAMDFFTVPTATFRVLYVWFAMDTRGDAFFISMSPSRTAPRRTTLFSTATPSSADLALDKETPAWRHAKHTLPLRPYLDLADCIIATTLRRESRLL
jgi:hypothetical protein